MNPDLDHLRSWVEIHLGALERNLRGIRNALPTHLRFISVVKANGYGHGLGSVVSRLMQARTDAFAVANLDEAAALSEIGTGWPVLVLSALLPSEFPRAVELGVTPVLSSAEELDLLQNSAAKAKQSASFHLKIDTGMGRLGVWHANAAPLLATLPEFPNLELTGLCTHFSSADSDPDFTRIQRNRFLASIPDNLRGKELLFHADNSAGLESFTSEGPFNAARIGLLQFGIRPHPASLLAGVPVDPVLSFHCRVGLVKILPANTPVSYGQTFRTRKPTPIAVLTAGYADGIPTDLSNRGSILIQGSPCPILGRVTMDQTVVDLSNLDPLPQKGDIATVFDANPHSPASLSKVAQSIGRIEWELLTGISSRTRRLYQPS